MFVTASLMSGNVKLSDGTEVNVNEKVDGAPSVVFDAVALLMDNPEDFKSNQAARDFVTDAVSHKKFIAYTDKSEKLITELSHLDKVDAGMIKLDGKNGAKEFIKECAKLRYWKR